MWSQRWRQAAQDTQSVKARERYRVFLIGRYEFSRVAHCCWLTGPCSPLFSVTFRLCCSTVPPYHLYPFKTISNIYRYYNYVIFCDFSCAPSTNSSYLKPLNSLEVLCMFTNGPMWPFTHISPVCTCPSTPNFPILDWRTVCFFVLTYATTPYSQTPIACPRLCRWVLSLFVTWLSY